MIFFTLSGEIFNIPCTLVAFVIAFEERLGSEFSSMMMALTTRQ
jgi:hypothetical protein